MNYKDLTDELLLDNFDSVLKGGRYLSIIGGNQLEWYYMTPAHNVAVKNIDTAEKADISRVFAIGVPGKGLQTGSLFIRAINRSDNDREVKVPVVIFNMLHPAIDKIINHYRGKGYKAETYQKAKHDVN